MNAASPRPFHSDYSYPRADHGTGSSEKSPGKVLRFDGVDAERFRAWFTPTFARWLQANFRNPEVVAATFGVRYRTALNWWNADNRAQGDIIGLVFVTFPQALSWFMAEWSDHEGRA